MKLDLSSLMQQLLDLHLSRTIDRLKGEDVMSSKFRELADGIRKDLQNFDQQADELMARREQLRRRGEGVFAKHREHQADVAAGLDALESAIADVEGGNSKKLEGSGDTSGSSFQQK